MDKQKELDGALLELSNNKEAETLAMVKLNDAIRFNQWSFVAKFAKELESICDNRDMINDRIKYIKIEMEQEKREVIL